MSKFISSRGSKIAIRLTFYGLHSCDMCGGTFKVCYYFRRRLLCANCLPKDANKSMIEVKRA